MLALLLAPKAESVEIESSVGLGALPDVMLFNCWRLPRAFPISAVASRLVLLYHTCLSVHVACFHPNS